jgi:choline dehydrogenase/4-pyridoxate dehydrogenase
MLSGIGDPAELEAPGHPGEVALPDIRQVLQDHVSVILMYHRKTPGPFLPMMRYDRIGRELAKAYLFGKGFAADVPGGITAFLKSRSDLALPDIQFLLTAAPLGAWPYLRPFKEPFRTASPAASSCCIRKAGGGWACNPGPGGRSPDPAALPGDGWRLAGARAGVRLAREVASQPAMQPYIAREDPAGRRQDRR